MRPGPGRSRVGGTAGSNAEEVDAGWYADHLARAAQVKATEASRVKRRDAAAVAVASAISALRRQIAETQRTTAARTATEAARARQSATAARRPAGFPALYGPEVDLWPDVGLLLLRHSDGDLADMLLRSIDRED